MRGTKDTLRCSFCGKARNEVSKLIAGPTVHICNECVNICIEIFVDSARMNGETLHQALPCLEEVESVLLNSEYFQNQIEAHKLHH